MNNSIRDAFFTALDGRIHSEESTSVSLATEQAYQHDWNRFSQWCLDQESIELPAHPKTVSLFLRSEQEAGAGAATLNRRVAAISYMHRNANLPPPLAHGEAALIREVLARPKTSVRRRSAQRPGIENWRLVLEAIPEIDPEDLRDRALVALHVSA
ncbi:MAG TPA: site-specific integrase, partial [Acidisoma sp.]|nr:site-specific integrase [Acidisoma sp.]